MHFPTGARWKPKEHRNAAKIRVWSQQLFVRLLFLLAVMPTMLQHAWQMSDTIQEAHNSQTASSACGCGISSFNGPECRVKLAVGQWEETQFIGHDSKDHSPQKLSTKWRRLCTRRTWESALLPVWGKTPFRKMYSRGLRLRILRWTNGGHACDVQRDPTNSHELTSWTFP